MSAGIRGSAVGFVSSRWKLLCVLNVVFFGVAFSVSLAMSIVLPPTMYFGQRVYVLPQFLYMSLPLMVLFIFSFNLALSAFAFVTLPGFVFFPLSAALLTVRAGLWGLILYPLPAWLFLAALPTVVLEGEAYVLAAGVGVAVGYSWLTPLEDEPRSEAFKGSFKRDASAYAFVVLLLLAAAVVESATITLVQM